MFASGAQMEKLTFLLPTMVTGYPTGSGQEFSISSLLPKTQGQGLGLPVAKAIVERYRGMIRSRTSTLDGRNGTTFRISLPLRDYQAPAYVG